MESVLCFLGYLLLNLEAAAFRADDVDFFSGGWRAFRLRFERSDQAGCHRVSEIVRSEILS